MSPWTLPTSLTVGDVGYQINTDFRTVLYILQIFGDPDYEQDEQAAICLRVLYPDWESIPPDRYQEALERAMEFIDAGVPSDSGKKPRTVDFEQDAGLIIPAVNRVLGQEVRSIPYLHWWTFLGAYMEIGESLFSTVVGIRQKKAKGKKLEKHELEFYKTNRAMVEMKKRETEQDIRRKEELRRLFV